MTVDEKQSMIRVYCDANSCCSCKIRKAITDINTGVCKVISDLNESELDDAINLINKEILLKTTPILKLPNINTDPIKPGYYNDSKITPFNVIDDWNLDFYLGNAVKYIKRAGKKDGNSRLQDLKKIREYIDQEIRLEEGREC